MGRRKARKQRLTLARERMAEAMDADFLKRSVTGETHKVLVMCDHIIEYPEIWLEVFLAPDNVTEERMMIEMFARARCRRASAPELADLVIFGGGADVNPELYEEQPHSSVRSDPDRDQRDIELYNKCYNLGIPMIGICRGAQFLHVMNGGKLFQHSDGHHKGHSMQDSKTKVILHSVSSSHHQVVRENQGMTVLGVSPGVSHTRFLNPTVKDVGTMDDIEAYYYRDTGCLGFQGHPEYSGYPQYTKWCLQKIQEFFVNSLDFGLKDKMVRMKDHLLKERDESFLKESV